MWDDYNYPPRKVGGFYTQDELELIIQRRKDKESLSNVYIDSEIAGREYQLEAIKSVCGAFQEGHRRALLVMATGTGKTRTAISISKILIEKNWVKNILFLADRKILVKLEKIFFNKLGTNKEFNNVYGDKSVTQVVRNIVGLDPYTASEIFSKYINYSNLNVKQIQFVKMLIDYVIRNGTIDMIVLTEEPFRSLGEIADLFEGKGNIFIEMRKDIENINENVKKLG